MSADGIRVLVRFCPGIERLHIHECVNVSDQLLVQIAASCKKLKCFAIDCDTVSDRGVMHLMDSCPLLCEVDVGYESLLSEDVKDRIEAMCTSRK